MKKQKAPKKKGMIVVYFLFILIPIIWFFFLNKGSDQEQASKALTGKWLRSDGTYTIEIKEVRDENKLVAFYFNPNPINVAKTMWSMEDDILEVYIEMNDTNYQGSNYKLTYDDQTDQLVGFYYQVVAKETYEVSFNKQ